jgi:hypothetical protein
LKDFDGFGAFWLPQKPEEELTGHLTFDHEKGCRLRVIGGFGDIHPWMDSIPQPRIVGVVGSERVTLENCRVVHATLPLSGTKEQIYHADGLFLGHIFDHDFDMTFNAVTIKFDSLAGWVGRSLIQVEHTFKKSDSAGSSEVSDDRDDRYDFARAKATLGTAVSEDFEYGRGILKLGLSGGYGGDRLTKFHMTSEPYMSIVKPHLTAFSEFMEEVNRLQDLITLCTDRPCGVLSIAFSRDDIPLTSINNDSFGYPKWIEYRASVINPPNLDPEPLHSGNMLVSFENVGGLEFVAKWLNEAPRLSAVIGSLMSSRYRAKMYVENRFLNMTAAAESFHRLSFDGSRFSEAEFSSR